MKRTNVIVAFFLVPIVIALATTAGAAPADDSLQSEIGWQSPPEDILEVLHAPYLPWVWTAPTGEFIPYVVFDSDQQHGAYVGLEWSFCRIEAVKLAGETASAVRVRAGSIADLRAELAPGERIELRNCAS